MFTNEENTSKKFINFRLITFILLSVVTGILVSYFMLTEKPFYAIFMGILFFVSLVLYLIVNLDKKRLKTKLIFILVFVISFSLGGVLFNGQVNDYSRANLNFKTQDVTATVDYVEETTTGVKLHLSKVAVKGVGKLDYGIELRVYGYQEYKLGDRINFIAKLSDKEIIYDGRFASNNIANEIKYSAFVDSSDVVVIENDPTIFQKINNFIKENLKSGMSENSYSIAYALLTGGSETIDEEVITTFRNTGVAHIFAVSGLHIGFLAVALSFLFTKLRFNAYLKAIIITFAVFFYSGICGFSASSIRACIMTSILLFTSATGYKYDGLTSVSFAGLIILIASPVQLLCVGFQLSFSVVLGILILTPSLTKFFRFLPNKFANSLATVISAQLSGLPIMLYAFNQFSAISIIVNLVFIPIVGVLFTALLILLVIGVIFAIPKIALFLPDQTLKLLIFLIKFFDKEFFLIGGFTLGIFAVSYVLFILIASGFFNFKKLTTLILCLVLATTCIVGTTIKTLTKDGERIYVSGSDNLSFTLLAEDKDGVLIVSKISQNFYSGRLTKLLERGEIENVSAIIITDQLGVKDFSQVVTRLITVTNTQTVYYYSTEPNQTLINVVGVTYPKVILTNYTELVTENKIDFNVCLNGRCVWFTVNNKMVGVFSEFENQNPYYHGIENKFDLGVYYNYTEILQALYSKDKTVSYTFNNEYANAESRGYLKYYL